MLCLKIHKVLSSVVAGVVLVVPAAAWALDGELQFEETFEAAPAALDWSPLPEGAVVLDGVLTLTPKGGGEDIGLISSKRTFRYAALEARIKVDEVAQGRIFYLGFFSVEPWGADCCWVLIEGSNFKFQTRREEGQVDQSISGLIGAGSDGWHVVKIAWSEQSAEIYWDGQYYGSITDPALIPGRFLPVVLNANSTVDPAPAFIVDWIKITGGEQR